MVVAAVSRRLVVVAVLAAACFAVTAFGVAHDVAPLAWLDRTLLDAAARFGASRPGWVTGWDVFCTVLGPTAFRIAAVVLAVVAVRQRNVRATVFLLVCVALSGAITQTVKVIADRPRPVEAFVDAHSSSFPSGHALGVMVGVVALLAVAPLEGTARRVAVVLGALIVGAVGAGRVVLCVHHPSDVVAGWALGVVWVALCLLVIRPTPLMRRQRTGAPAATGGGAPAGTPPAPDNAR